MEYPGIFFFPFSEPTPVGVLGLETGVLARRIPDFLCICLNDNGNENAGLLEIRAADENGVPTGEWASWDELPEPNDLLSFLPEEGVEAAVVGTMKRTRPIEPPAEGIGDGIEIDLTLIRGRDAGASRSFPWHLSLKDPGASCVDLARRIAKEFSLPINPSTWEKLGTKNPDAFLAFLRGLDGAALLDAEVIGERDPADLLEPMLEAVERDPDFGLALRRLHVAITEAVNTGLLGQEAGLALVDRAYITYPSDKEACAIIGEFMAAIDENDRAEDWLRLAINQPEPPAAALETLGILLANRGETVQARNLWLTGVRVDGHPDFFAHLARLAFSEDSQDEAWDKVVRGLRRISERRLHPGEWDDEVERGGVLLRYLSEHLEEGAAEPPPDVIELLADMHDQIKEPEDRLDLGICLLRVGRNELGTAAIRAALPHVEDADRRDIGAQHLAESTFEGFEDKFEHAASIDEPGPEADAALGFLRELSDEIPQFWPSHYFLGKILSICGDDAAAYEALRKAAGLRRDQSPIFAKLSVAAHRLGRLDEAIEAMRAAVKCEPNAAGLYADLALLLHRDGQEEAARRELELGETLDSDNAVVVRVRRILDGDDG